jgi:16S rRNA (cytidine1402-2'-O)-methyltransferase
VSKGKLYLVPNLLDAAASADSLSGEALQAVRTLKTFIVETEKVARAFFKKAQLDTPQSGLTIHLLNEHTKREEIAELLKACDEGENMGLLSDAGLPCIADPGALVVALAHRNGIEVLPLTGPSSIFLALMASGLNGQQFAFQGYLPIERAARAKRIKELETESAQRKQTQIFIETPYRNNPMMQDLVKTLAPHTRLCVACGMHTPEQWIQTKPAFVWAKSVPDLHKKPTVFLLQA